MANQIQVFNATIAFFDSESEDVKSAAAFAVGMFSSLFVMFIFKWYSGSIAIGDMDIFLSPILKMTEKGDGKKLLALHALKEVVLSLLSNNVLWLWSKCQVVTNASSVLLETVADRLWNPLFENSAGSEEASRNVAASCLGKLTTLKPAVYLPRLQVIHKITTW